MEDMAVITNVADELGGSQLPSIDRSRGIEYLFQEHYTGLCRLAYLIVGDRRIAEELVMDAFLRTFSAWGRIRSHDSSGYYLRRVVINLCRTRVRREPVEEPLEHDPEADVDGVDGAIDVWQAVRLLPTRQRTAIVLRYYEDLPDAEIARLMRCSEGTVKSQLAKARATLKKLLKEEDHV